MEKSPRLLPPIVYAIIAGALFVIAARPETLPGLAVVLNIAGTSFGIAALVSMTLYIEWGRVYIQAEKKRVECMTPHGELLKLTARLPLAHIEFLTKNFPVLLIEGGEPEPRKYFRTFAEDVPWENLVDFFRLSPGRTIYAIRNYSDGSSGRRYAQALTDYLAYFKFVVLSRGNRSAEWADHTARARAMRFVGLKPDELNESTEEVK